MVQPRLASAILLLASIAAPAWAQERARVVVVAVEDQIIHPVSQRYLARAFQQARDQDARCVVILLDTPGGLMDSTRHIVKDILASEVPIVVYVAPHRARCNSAGVFLALAAHVTAMAPGTNIGTAQPMMIGRGLVPGALGDRRGDPIEMILADNMVNDAEAWAKALAEFRRRNVDWAIKAVRESISTPATEAAREGIIDFVAADETELLKKLDGMTVQMIGRTATIRTQGAIVERIRMTWAERSLSLLANPTLAYLLLLLGFSGLVFEITHPGTWIPGIAGGICLVLAFFALQMLPINYAGLGLILLGLLLVVLEVKLHSYGLLTTGGIACLLVGSVMLIEPVEGIERVSWAVVGPASATLAFLMLFLVNRVVRAHRAKVQTGIQNLIGSRAQVKGVMDGDGFVYVDGALWHARCDVPLQDGESAVIESCDGLTLHVRPLSDDVSL